LRVEPHLGYVSHLNEGGKYIVERKTLTGNFAALPNMPAAGTPGVVMADNTIRLTDEQAKAILEIRLQRLTALGIAEIAEEVQKLGIAIADYLDILRSRPRVLAIVKDELAVVRKDFATPRKTEIVEAEIEVEDEDLIEREDVAVTVTHAGYIKRTPVAEYRVQGRGGKGRAGMATREEDYVTNLFVASTHAPLVFFSSIGMAYKLKVWRLPETRIQGRGKAMVNLPWIGKGLGIQSRLGHSSADVRTSDEGRITQQHHTAERESGRLQVEYCR